MGQSHRGFFCVVSLFCLFFITFFSNCKASNSTAFWFRISIIMIRSIDLEELIQHTVIYGRTHRLFQQETLSSISFYHHFSRLFCCFLLGWLFHSSLHEHDYCYLMCVSSFTAVQGLAWLVSFLFIHVGLQVIHGGLCIGQSCVWCSAVNM